MSPTILVLLGVLVYLNGNEASNYIIDETIYEEDTEHEIICANASLELNFANLQITEIHTKFLSSPLIKCLDLANNRINDVQPNAFENLQNLKYLALSNNNFYIDNLFKNNFDKLEILVVNNARSNNYLRITGIYPMLRKMFLKHNNIHNIIDVKSYAFPRLTHLYLSENEYEIDDFDWLPETLKYLDLSNHKLSSITLSNLPFLTRLILRNYYNYNSLSEVHFENLTSLEYLDISSNRIKEILYSTFVNMSSLLYLNVSSNDIRYIDQNAFNSVENLKCLNLSNNKIDFLEGNPFEKLVNLETLLLEKNVITRLPAFSNETSLETVKLNCNKIKNIVGGTFVKMPKLKSLYLHDNEISYIDQEAFFGLTNLKLLTLSNNQLSVMPANWMLPLSRLEELDLIGNNFFEFGNIAIHEFSILKNVYLSNQIKMMHGQAMLSVPENVTINLQEDFKFVESCSKTEDKYSSHNYYG